MLKVILSNLKKNSLIFTGTFCTIALIAAIIGACLNLISGCITSADFGHRFDACTTVISAKDTVSYSVENDDEVEIIYQSLNQSKTLSEKEIDTFKKIAETKEYIADYSFDIAVKINGMNCNLPVYGHNFSAVKLSGFTLKEGSAPSENEIVIDEILSDKYKLKTGESLYIKNNKFQSIFIISGIIECKNKEIYTKQNFVFFEDNFAAKVGNGIYNFGIFTLDSSLNRELSKAGFDVFTGKDVNKAEFPFLQTQYFSPMIVFITMGSICLLASIFVLYGTISFSVQHRQKEIALLRTLGTSRGQLFGMLLIENFIISLPALLLGIFLSFPLASIIRIIFINIKILSPIFTISANYFMLGILSMGLIILPSFVSYRFQQK